MASVPKGRATAPSKLDGETKEGFRYLVRYQYAPLSVKDNSESSARKWFVLKGYIVKKI